MTHIALFGTSADPPTSGHQAIINWLSQHYDWVAVWASDNPFKSHQTPLEHRQTMLRLLISEINPTRHNISLNPELSISRSLETVTRAKTAWPNANLTLVIGSDLINQLPRWYRVEDLLQQVQLLVIPRPRSPIDDVGVEKLKQMGGKIAIASFLPPDVSSTAYRESGDIKNLTSSVKKYIHKEQLYQCQEELEKLQIR
jgi:nicotinate-nucleotide adenylyltransferase